MNEQTIDYPMPPGFYNADCLEEMKKFPDKFFDLAITDPPYGIGADKFANGSNWKGHKGKPSSAKKCRLNQGAVKLKGRILNNSDCSWDTEPPQKEYFDELFRVSQNQIIWGSNYFPLPPSRCIVVWDKMQPWENFSQVEIAWTSFDKPAALFKMANFAPGKIHPTEKPVALYQFLLDRYAKPGMKILDTHVGSASSLIACERAGMEYWGFEIDEMYYQKAKERLDKEKAQVNMMELISQAEQKEEQLTFGG